MTKCVEKPSSKVTWDRFLPDVVPYVRGVPDEVAMHHVRRAAIEFASRSGVIVRTYYADLWAGVENYHFVPSDSYVPSLVRRVIVDGQQFPALPDYPTGPAYGSYYEYPDTIYLFPTPTRDIQDGLLIEVSVQPSQDSCEIEHEIYERYGTYIASGACASLMLMKGTDWYNPTDAGKFKRQFDVGVNRAKVWRARGNQAAPMYVRSTKPWY